MQIAEYNYYNATLSVSIVTQRPDATPSSILAAATLHEQYAAEVRVALREYKRALNAYLPYYDVIKITLAGTSRDSDRETNQEIMRISFMLGFSMTGAAQIADERLVFAFERNIEKAVRDLFTAEEIPNVFIAGDGETLGESFIHVQLSMGTATEIGLWNITETA
jgi:hypothetical protein